MPLLYRDAPLNSIWEGSGNVAALDVLRATVREPEGLTAFAAECDLARGADPRLDAHLDRTRDRPSRPCSPAATATAPSSGCSTASSRPAAWSRTWRSACRPSLLVRHAPAAVADAFCAARLGGGGGRVYGTLPAGVDARAIVDRALPA